MDQLRPEWQHPELRAADQLWRLNQILPNDRRLNDLSDLSALPVLRKSDLSARQRKSPPFGDLPVSNVARIFQSPGPIHEPGGAGGDWWRFGTFLFACGVGPQDVVQNTFSYHFTPAGVMFESAAIALGAKVFAAGPGQSAQQAEVASQIGTTTYIGTPDFLGRILEAGDEQGLDLSRLKKALVTGGPLFETLRKSYLERGIATRQCYATADVGLIAYESDAQDGLIVDDGCIVEVVTPGTGNPVDAWEVGEVLVTSLNPDYPLVRFATGDLSSILPGLSPCGRTNIRLTGWKGAADQATKVRGVFIRPEQIAVLVERLPEVGKARVEITRNGLADRIAVVVEATEPNLDRISAVAREILKLRVEVVPVHPGELPDDGLVVDDRREISG